MTIGYKIKQLRKQRKITQQQLAETIGKSYSIVQKYENDLVTPPWDSLTKIASAYNITISELIDGVDMWADTNAQSEFELNDQVREDTLNKLDRLNQLGKEKALDYITDLSEQEKYTK